MKQFWKNRWLWACGLGVLFLGGLFELRQATSPPKFPRPAAAAALPKALASRPLKQGSVPSIPGLEPMTPQLMSSVNEIHAAFAPCLTADLKTIIFAGWISRKTEYDLYIATREAVDQPFSKPQLLTESVTPWTDAFPTLSSDGLELVFTSSDDASPSVMPRLLRCKRPAVGQPFSKPEPLPFPGVDAQAVRVWCPQFIDDLRLKFWLIGPKEQRSIVLARRKDRLAEFAKPENLPFDDAFTLWHLTPDGARAYAGNHDGIHLTHRASVTERFGAAELLIPASLTGPVDGPIWVAPQEDVIFYCSPGPGKAPGADRLLWMVAF